MKSNSMQNESTMDGENAVIAFSSLAMLTFFWTGLILGGLLIRYGTSPEELPLGVPLLYGFVLAAITMAILLPPGDLPRNYFKSEGQRH